MSEKAVWMIEYFECEDTSVVGIFSTLEKAKATIKFLLTEHIKALEEEMGNPYMEFAEEDIKEMKDTLSRLDDPLSYTEGSYFVIHNFSLTKVIVDKIY